MNRWLYSSIILLLLSCSSQKADVRQHDPAPAAEVQINQAEKVTPVEDASESSEEQSAPVEMPNHRIDGIDSIKAAKTKGKK